MLLVGLIITSAELSRLIRDGVDRKSYLAGKIRKGYDTLLWATAMTAYVVVGAGVLLITHREGGENWDTIEAVTSPVIERIRSDAPADGTNSDVQFDQATIDACNRLKGTPYEIPECPK